MVSPTAPNPWKRLGALIVDSIVVLIPAGIIGGPLMIVNGDFGSIIMWSIYIVGLGTRDAWPIPALNGTSLGKKLLGLKAVRSDGSNCDYETSFKRNLPLLVSAIGMVFSSAISLVKIPFLGLIILIASGFIGFAIFLVEAYKVFTDERGLRIGDLFASSLVTETGAVASFPTSSTGHHPPPPPQGQADDPPPPPPPPPA